MSFITSYCRISKDKCSVNGKNILLINSDSELEWIKQLYKSLQIDYPKFYKMDVLSKLAFIGTELIKKNSDFNFYTDDDVALVFANRHSSGDTDLKFNNSYQQELMPSPALFVYTLPNILIGEIAIRNKWHGENLFTVAREFDATFFQNYCNILLSKNSQACVCGWIDAMEDNLEAFLFFVEVSDTSKLNLPFTSKIVANLYKA